MSVSRFILIDNLPAELRLIRKENGLTLKEVANLAGISFTFLSDVERGRVNPSLETLKRLSGVYRVLLVVSIGEVSA